MSTRCMVGILPGLEIMRWHHAEENFSAKELFGRTPNIKGARIRHSTGRSAFAIWYKYWWKSGPNGEMDGRMFIIRLVADHEAEKSESEGMIAALLHAAMTEAISWNI